MMRFIYHFLLLTVLIMAVAGKGNKRCDMAPYRGDTTKYLNIAAASPVVMPCPAGTVFNPKKCRCDAVTPRYRVDISFTSRLLKFMTRWQYNLILCLLGAEYTREMKSIWITVLWGLSVVSLTQGARCYRKGSPINDREYVRSFAGKEEVYMCDGKEVFDPVTCSCVGKNHAYGGFPSVSACDKRPHSRNGTVFEQQTLSGTWNLMTCPSGLIFNRYICNCDYKRNVLRFQHRSGNPECYTESVEMKGLYKLVINHNVEIMSCNEGYLYNPNSCSCVQVDKKCDKIEMDRKGRFFKQWTEDKWTVMPCGAATMFNLATCKCEHRI